MIGSLRGSVLERTGDTTVLLEVGGVGYLVTVTPRTLAELEPTSSAFLHVHHHIREDAQTLYGFLRRDERTTFEVLIATHGVGPAMAMAIIGTHTPNALVDIIAARDLGALTLVPGVGRKTAERLVVELGNRLQLPMLDPIAPTAGNTTITDVRDALLGLGYTDSEVREALRELPAADADSASMLRDALQLLGAKRA
jgi:Holliday junction DNA helicase RuvA